MNTVAGEHVPNIRGIPSQFYLEFSMVPEGSQGTRREEDGGGEEIRGCPEGSGGEWCGGFQRPEEERELTILIMNRFPSKLIPIQESVPILTKSELQVSVPIPQNQN